ncbi:MAG TPA: 50S ribosomal protein L29 [Patescibacteria group bacterium]|nr:50S ribosomal protein L29 [Patescibacteria group bacterium]
MTKKDMQDLKSKSVEELKAESIALRTEIAKLTIERGINPQKDTNSIMKKRKRLARILTILGEKSE